MKILWPKIILTISVAMVLIFLFSYPTLTGNASLCITIKPSEIISQTFYEKEPYTVYKEVGEPYSYVIISAQEGTSYYNYLYKKIGKVEIKNADEHSGIFTVKAKFIDEDNKEEQILSYDIAPEKTKLFYFEYFDKYRDTDKANFTYEIIPPTKKVNKVVTEYKEVERIKEIETEPEVKCL